MLLNRGPDVFEVRIDSEEKFLSSPGDGGKEKNSKPKSKRQNIADLLTNAARLRKRGGAGE